MTLYQIYSAIDNEEAYVDLKQDDRKIVEFINAILVLSEFARM